MHFQTVLMRLPIPPDNLHCPCGDESLLSLKTSYMPELVGSCAASHPKGLLSVKDPPTKNTGPLESFPASQVFPFSKKNNLFYQVLPKTEMLPAASVCKA